MALLDVGALRLSVTREGPRGSRPLLVLHGFTGVAEELLEPARALTDRERIGVDLVGHGGSDAPIDTARYRFTRALDDLATVLDQLDVPRVDVWGYSQGGRLALAFALANLSRVEKLVLESASPGLASNLERVSRRRDDEALACFIEREGIEAFVARWEALPLFATERELPTHERAALRAVRLAQRPLGLANALRGLGTGTQPSLWDSLGALRCPTLLLTGARDPKFDRIARDMAPRMPNSRHISIEGAGHAPHREKPEACIEAIRAFLRIDVEIEKATARIP